MIMQHQPGFTVTIAGSAQRLFRSRRNQDAPARAALFMQMAVVLTGSTYGIGGLFNVSVG